MSTLHLAVADAVRAAIDGESWSLSFTPATFWRVRFQATELETLKVSVTPGPSTESFLTRGRDVERYTADVIVQKQCDPASNTAADALVALVEELRAWFRRKHLTANGRAMVCVEREFLTGKKAGIDTALTENAHIFTAALRTHWQITGAP